MGIIREMVVEGDDGVPAKILRIRERQYGRVAAGICTPVVFFLAGGMPMARRADFWGVTMSTFLLATLAVAVVSFGVAAWTRWLDVYENGSAVVRRGFLVPMWSRRFPMQSGGRLELASFHRVDEADGGAYLDNDCFVAMVDANGWRRRLVAPSSDDDLAAIREAIERHTGRPLMFHRWDERPKASRRV